MTSPRLLTPGRCGAWAIGSCLIVSAFLRPELPFEATDYLADLFLGKPLAASDALMWLLIAMAGVRLMAVRRGACFLVYVAFLYSLVPWGPEFSVFPVTPVLKALLGGQTTAGRVALHLLNGLFVLVVIGVHVTLAKTSAVRVSSPSRLALLSGIAASIAVLVGALSAAVLWEAIPDSVKPIVAFFWPSPDTVRPFTVIAYLTLLGIPLAAWGIPSFAVACVRLRHVQRTPPQLQKDGDDAVHGRGDGTALTRGPALSFQFTFSKLSVLSPPLLHPLST